VAQGVGPEFKPQYQKKKEKKNPKNQRKLYVEKKEDYVYKRTMKGIIYNDKCINEVKQGIEGEGTER
jgi:hypothetical protein